MYIILVGGGNVGYSLSKILLESNHQVVLIDKDKEICEEIANEIITLLTFQHGDIGLVEFDLSAESSVINKKIKDISTLIPENCVLVSLIRNNKVIFPRGETVLKSEDEILAMTTLDAKRTGTQYNSYY